MAMGEVHVQLAGDFGVWVAGRCVDADRWPTRRAVEVVQLLALAHGHRLLRDQVVEALWPHLDPAAGAANLRKAAHHARRALGDPNALVLRRGAVALFPEHHVSTDVERLVSAATKAVADSDVASARGLAEAWPGVLLPDELYAEWTQAPRARLHDLHVDVLRLAGHWQQLTELDPTDEQACRALMRENLAAGRRHDAIGAYGRLRAALRLELGVSPDPSTQELYAACESDPAPPAPAFVGREVELALMRARLRSTRGGSAPLVAVRGPGGIGKTAFLARAGASADAEGWHCVTVSAGPSEGPYATLAAAVEELVALRPDLLVAVGSRARSVLAQLCPAMIDATEQLESPVTRHLVIGAARRLLTCAGGTHGTMLVIDDAHLADAASIDALLHLGAVAAAPLLTVLAYRPEAAPETLRRGVARLTRAGASIGLDLGGLEPHEATALAVGAGVAEGGRTLAELVDVAAGNPFFVLELARGTVAGGPPRLAGSQHEAVVSRFADLDDGVVARLRRLALAGDDADLSSVVALSGCDEPEASDLLDAALRAGVLVIDRARYRFAHALVRQALIDEVPPHHRVAIHREAAGRLAELGASPAIVAHHWTEGGRPDLAAPWLLSAARHSVALAAFRDALDYLGPFLRHAPDHVEGLLLRAESLEALGEGAALTAYADAASAAGASAAHEIVPRHALAQIKQGDPAGALRTLEGSRPTTVQARLAHALTLAGAAALGFGDPSTGAARAAESRRLALDSGDSASLVIASWANAAAAHARGELRDSVRIDLDETRDLPRLAVSVFDGQLCITQRLLYGARPYDDVIAFADSLASEASRLGALRGQAFARTLGGEAKLLAGRLDDADQDLAAGERLHHRIAASTGVAFSLQRRAEVALQRGLGHQARAMLDDALCVAQESDVGFHLFDRIYGARIVAAEDPDAALAALEAAEEAVLGPAETCPGCRITLSVPAAIAAARAGDLERAATYERSTVFLADVVMRLPAWYAALDEVRGHIEAARGRGHLARSHLEQAAKTYRQAGQPLDAARCRALATDTR